MDAAGGANRSACRPAPGGGYNSSCVAVNDTDSQWVGSSIDEIVDHFLNSLFTYREPRTIILTVLYTLLFILALVGNLVVIAVIMCNQSMRSVTNYFLFNLAVADLLVTVVCIPMTVGRMIYRVWIYGAFVCKATSYLQGVSIAANVLTITALSLDRYIAIRHPVRSRALSTKRHVRAAILLIWVVAAVIMLPLLLVQKLLLEALTPGGTLAYCHEMWPSMMHRRVFDWFLVVFIYVVPGFVVTISYSLTGCRLLMIDSSLQRGCKDASHPSQRIMEGRRRVARMLIMQAVLFAVSWMPYHITILYTDFSHDAPAANSTTLLSFALLLGHGHSAHNPILYCMMSARFKRCMVDVIHCRRSRRPPHFRTSISCNKVPEETELASAASHGYRSRPSKFALLLNARDDVTKPEHRLIERDVTMPINGQVVTAASGRRISGTKGFGGTQCSDEPFDELAVM